MTTVGVVIPTLREATTIGGILADLANMPSVIDVVVVDGGSDDGTVDVACAAGARVMASPPGRALQLNTGAGAVRGEWLCFLHADVRMPLAARDALETIVTDPKVSAAVWRFGLDGPGVWFRLIEFGTLVRDRIGGLPYGDQGLLVRRTLFQEVGGYPEIPLMEDVAIVRALRRHGRLKRLSGPLIVSNRRWKREGPYKTWVRNAGLVAAYLAGVPPARLARWYRPEPK